MIRPVLDSLVDFMMLNVTSREKCIRDFLGRNLSGTRLEIKRPLVTYPILRPMEFTMGQDCTTNFVQISYSATSGTVRSRKIRAARTEITG